ncbi:sugar ABC transporter permease [Acidaminobacter sp. JC074]|uniref:carbohydrate ABC transporter permease n=1 Tax=Acidaminobacter sp. JC074 TaxID=2530199 RepID=UPI001F10DD89|nr:sugar ABC transporter permease [Acidaminobacter sp. JC074]MCH4889624.1 sugar ABC transporter permease [Acidaminobacter sp. JC074]
MNRKHELKSFLTFGLIPLLAFICVLLIPFLNGLVLTFTDWNGFEMNEFIGLDNYIEAFKDESFWHTMGFTFKYVFFTVVTTNIVAFGLALLVSSQIKGRNFLRSTFFLPNLIGGVILGFIWQFIFARLLTYVGSSLEIEFIKYSWLVDPDKAFWAMILVSVWQMSGYMMIIYITGLTSIPNDVLEASSIDGATKMRQLFSIKIPLMIQSFTISIFLTIKNSFMVYDVNLALTKGGPYRATELVTMHIYNESFQYHNYGTGQAKAVILFLIVMAISLTQVFLTKRLEVES